MLAMPLKPRRAMLASNPIEEKPAGTHRDRWAGRIPPIASYSLSRARTGGGRHFLKDNSGLKFSNNREARCLGRGKYSLWTVLPIKRNAKAPSSGQQWNIPGYSLLIWK